MNPVEIIEGLSTYLNSSEILDTVKRLHSANGEPPEVHLEATAFLNGIVERYDKISDVLKKPPCYKGVMDYLCRLDDGTYAVVEIQVVPHKLWGLWALAYVAAVYSQQMRRGAKWRDIKKVIGINILGRGKEDIVHWKQSEDFEGDYQFVNQLGKGREVIHGMELSRYSVMKSLTKVKSKEQQEWLTLFKRAREMSREEVYCEIESPAVREAFELLEIVTWPSNLSTQYAEDDEFYELVSDHVEEQREEVRREEVVETITKKLLKIMPAKDVAVITGVSVERIQALQSKP